MKQELQNKLYEEFPAFFAEKDLPITNSLMAYGIECGDGWYELIRSLCKEIQEYSERTGKQVVATQVKEKFAGLRVYTNYHSDELRAILSKYEKQSFSVCEVTGEPGALCIRGIWYKTLSENIAKEQGYISAK